MSSRQVWGDEEKTCTQRWLHIGTSHVTLCYNKEQIHLMNRLVEKLFSDQQHGQLSGFSIWWNIRWMSDKVFIKSGLLLAGWKKNIVSIRPSKFRDWCLCFGPCYIWIYDEDDFTKITLYHNYLFGKAARSNGIPFPNRSSLLSYTWNSQITVM